MRQRIDVTRHIEDLWRYARILTRDDADADDLLQDALVRALSSAHTFNGSRSLLPWLITIVRNTFLTAKASAKAEARRTAAYADLIDENAPAEQEHSVQLAQVRVAIESLPLEQAEVLHLIGVLGFKYSEAADVLGVPTGTVMSRLSRARSALREYLEHPMNSFKIVGGRDVL